MVDYLYNTSRFFAHESCGQCTPCREGTAWMYKTIKRIKAGGGRIEDLDILGQMAETMGITPRDHDLRPGRRRGLADQERSRQVPARARGVHPDAPGRKDEVTPAPEVDRRRPLGRLPRNAPLPILPARPPPLRSPRVD